MQRPGMNEKSLRAALICAGIVLVLVMALFLLNECTHSIQGECRHSAVYAALVMGEEHPVRIISGPSYKTGDWHGQAEAEIDGEWKALCVDEDYVYVCKRHNWFEPLGYKSVQSYMEQQFDWAIESVWKKNLKKGL